MKIKNLLRAYAVLFYRTLILFIRVIQRFSQPKFACFLQNVFLILHGSSLRFNYDQKSKLFIANQLDIVRYFGDMDRGFDFYGRSLLARGESLAKSYCLQKIKFANDDIVVDCGANYGDLYIALHGKILEKNYIAFEPGPIEYSCLTKSLPNSRIFNLGLSNTDGELDFYLCSATGDSSLIQPKAFTNIVKVNVTTMDSICDQLQIDKCKLFKLEAEGWEPEILQGSLDFLSICEYIAIDGGPERGLEAEPTFHILNNFLLERGFKMVDINGPGYRALYRNLMLKY